VQLGYFTASEACLQGVRPDLHLMFLHHDLLDPFASGDPASWFALLVSHVSALLLDAGGKVLLALAGWRVEGGKLLAPDAAPLFPAVLRCLRTTMQHALDLKLPKDKEKLNEAHEWYRSVCGQATPGPEYSRCLTDIVLGLWEAFARDLCDVVAFLSANQAAPEARPAWDRIESHAGRLSEEDLYDVALEVIRATASTLSVRDFVREYRDLINADLAVMGLRPEGLRLAAVRLVEDVVKALANPCPVSGAWLKAECSLVGRSIRDWLFRRRGAWMRLRPEARDAATFLDETRHLIADWFERRGPGDPA
jgi:hypothetical protein